MLIKILKTRENDKECGASMHVLFDVIGLLHDPHYDWEAKGDVQNIIVSL